MIHEYEDEYGKHVHEIKGPPFDPKVPITCIACHAKARAWRKELCDRYDWGSWPENLSVIKGL